MALYNANLKNNGYTKLYLDIAWGAPSIAGNYTPVTYSLYMKGEGGEWDREGSWGDITIDGVKSDFTLPSYDFRDKGVVTYTLVASNTVNIPHDIYGNKTLAYKAYYNPNNPGYMIAGTIQGSVSLPNIPRASKFTASDVTAGAANIPISLSKSPAATTHKAKVMFENTVICDKDIGASPTNIPLTAAEWLIFYNLTKTVESGTLSVILTSYNNSSVLGSDEKTVTATYADADMPTLTSVTIVDNNATVNSVIGATNYLQLLSQIKITANGATGVKSSTITGYELQVKQGTTVVGTYGANSPVYIPQSSGAFTALARVKDSRGRWSDWKSVAFTVLAYERPKITNYKNKRVTSAGADSIDGTYVKHEFSTSVTSVLIGGVQKNNIRYRIDRTSPTPVTTVLNTKTVLNTAATGSEIIGTYPATSTYDFLFVLTDAFDQQATAIDVISSAQFPLVVGIKGAAIGGEFNESGATAQIYGSLMATGYANFKEWARFEKYVKFDLSTLFTGVATFSSVPNFSAGTPVVWVPWYTDLNNYTTPGEYYCSENDIVQTIANTPSGNAFFLKVGKHAGIYQEFTEYLPNFARKWFRNNYDGTWGPWNEILSGYVYEVQRGGNYDNGWVKYSDRRMEQWKTLSIPNITFPTPLGAMFYAGYKAVGSWPVAFSTFNGTASTEFQCSQPDVFVVHGGVPNSTTAGDIYPFSARNAPATVFIVRIRAWGTW